MIATWSEQSISRQVTRKYIIARLQDKHQETLHRPLAFGRGLTDDTYLDWIIGRGRRWFLILDHIGVPDHILEVIDRALDDEDLPVHEETLAELKLFPGKSDTLEKKFYRSQFKYLVRDLVPGGHMDYELDEILPIDPISKRASLLPSHDTDKIHAYDKVYSRKKVLTNGEDGIERVHFVMHLKSLLTLHHPNLVSVWATYTQNNHSYMLLSPSIDLTLKSFLDEPPKAFKALPKPLRREILLTWTQDLTSAVLYLHSHNLSHTAIRPTAILVSGNNTIHLSDYSALSTLDSKPASYERDTYEHGPPEYWQRTPSLHLTTPKQSILPNGGRTSRRLPKQSTTRPPTISSDSSTPTTLITTFHPPSPSPTPSYPADIFSLSTIILTILSSLLSHSPKSFAFHRSRLNRSAGRGGAPADASFHANLGQVGKWMDMLEREAERKEERIFEGVRGLVGVCRRGLARDGRERWETEVMDEEVRRWVEIGVGETVGVLNTEGSEGLAGVRVERMVEVGALGRMLRENEHWPLRSD